MDNKNVPPSVGEFAIGERDQLLARVAEQAQTIERLKAGIPRMQEQLYQTRQELAALKQPSAGVDDRAARVIGYRPGMSEVTLLIDGGSVPAWMNIGDTVHISEQARAQLAAPAGVPAAVRAFVEAEALCSDCLTSEICCKPALREAKDALAATTAVGDPKLTIRALYPAPSPETASDGMCNADNPANCCVCREEFGYRVCTPASDVVPVPRELHAFELELKRITHDERTPNEISQELAALLIVLRALLNGGRS